eukprot:gene16507-biopygen4649
MMVVVAVMYVQEEPRTLTTTTTTTTKKHQVGYMIIHRLPALRSTVPRRHGSRREKFTPAKKTPLERTGCVSVLRSILGRTGYVYFRCERLEIDQAPPPPINFHPPRHDDVLCDVDPHTSKMDTQPKNAWRHDPGREHPPRDMGLSITGHGGVEASSQHGSSVCPSWPLASSTGDRFCHGSPKKECGG